MKAALIIASFVFLLGPIAGDSCRSKDASANNSNRPVKSKLANGAWGGDHIAAEVSVKGVQIEFDCASGRIEQTVWLDNEGRFDLKGKFAPEHGGPVRSDEPDTTREARYVGQVRGKTLELTISEVDGKKEIGSFTLVHGEEARIRKCR